MLIAASRLRDASLRARFLTMSRQFKDWLRQRDGFIRYELFESDEGWCDTMLWRDRASADDANRAFRATPIAAAFAEIVEPDFHIFYGRSFVLGTSETDR